MPHTTSMNSEFRLALGLLESGRLSKWLPMLQRQCTPSLDRPLCIAGIKGFGGRERWLPIVMPQLLRGWDGAVIEINAMDGHKHLNAQRAIQEAIADRPRPTFCGYIAPGVDALIPNDEPNYGFYPRSGPDRVSERKAHLRRVIAEGGYVDLGGATISRMSSETRNIVTNDLNELVGLITQEAQGPIPVVVVALGEFNEVADFLSQLIALAEQKRIALVVLAHETVGFAELNRGNCNWVLESKHAERAPSDLPKAIAYLTH